MDLAAVILAAGKGTRMKSDLPKVLHHICGRPMLEHVINAVKNAGVAKTVVVAGFGFNQVSEFLGQQASVVLQEEQLGTAHALLQAEQEFLDDQGNLLVVCGDTPLLRSNTLAHLVKYHSETGAAATILTARMDNPTGYGRVIRGSSGSVVKIVEQKDASTEELLVQEINTGVYCFRIPGLFNALKRISPANAQGEFYLTDVIQIFVQQELLVQAMVMQDAGEVQGINDRIQLAQAEAVLRSRVLEELMVEGVTVVDPSSTYVEQGVTVGRDTILLPMTFLSGDTKIGSGCKIGPSSKIVDSVIGNGVEVQFSVITGSSIGNGTVVGPYSYIRPGTVVGEDAKIGDFVEIKKSTIGNGSKIPHLSYVGDATIGEKVNIGAGTITCNYDGKNKFETVLEDGAFIGSNTNLVAPVKVGKGSVIAAGSTITKDVPEGALGVARERQSNIEGWCKKRKQ